MWGMSDKRLFKPIKGFFKVNFEDYFGFFPFYFGKMSNKLPNNDDIISNSPFGKEASLVGANDMIDMDCNYSGNNLSDDLILGITKSYGSKVPKIRSICAF